MFYYFLVDKSWSVQFIHLVMSDSLWPHGLQHAWLPCPSPTPGAYSNTCPSSQWYHPTISSSVVRFSSHLHSFPASGSFLMSQFFTSGGQSIGVSASTSVLPMNTQDWPPLGWTGWISSRVFSNTTVQKHQFFCAQHINCIFLFSGIWGSQKGCPMEEEVLESPPLCGQEFKVTT